jgi:hypothetical protein
MLQIVGHDKKKPNMERDLASHEHGLIKQFNYRILACYPRVTQSSLKKEKEKRARAS